MNRAVVSCNTIELINQTQFCKSPILLNAKLPLIGLKGRGVVVTLLQIPHSRVLSFGITLNYCSCYAKFQASLLWLRSHMYFAKTNNTPIETNGIRMSVSPDVRMCTRFFARLSNIHCYNPVQCSTLQTLHWCYQSDGTGDTTIQNRVPQDN